MDRAGAEGGPDAAAVSPDASVLDPTRPDAGADAIVPGDGAALDQSADAPTPSLATCDGGSGAAGVRAIAPLATATVTSHRPVLRWALPAGDDGAVVDLCADRACTRPAVNSFFSAGTGGTPPSALRPGVYFWRLHDHAGTWTSCATSPTWEFIVGARDASIDTSWGAAPDFNGDGFADVVIGTTNQNEPAGGWPSSTREARPVRPRLRPYSTWTGRISTAS